MEVYRVRGYPADGTEKALWRNIHSCRGLWNLLVHDGFIISREGDLILRKGLIYYLQDENYNWLKEVDIKALMHVEESYEHAVLSYLNGEGDEPQFRKKNHTQNLYITCCSDKKRPDLYIKGDYLKLPGIEKKIKLRDVSRICKGGVLENVVVSHEKDGWFFYLKMGSCDGLRRNPGGKGVNSSLYTADLSACIWTLIYHGNGEIPAYILSYYKAKERLEKEEKNLDRKLAANTDHYEVINGRKSPIYIRPLKECKNISKQMEVVDKVRRRIENLKKVIRTQYVILQKSKHF